MKSAKKGIESRRLRPQGPDRPMGCQALWASSLPADKLREREDPIELRPADLEELLLGP